MTRRTYLLDVNLLIALTNENHADHQRAHGWFTTVQSWATTPLTESAFVRLMLNPLVAGRKLARTDVIAALQALRSWSGHTFLPDDSSLAESAVDLISLIGYRQVTDFHLLNLAASHQALFATLDADFAAALIAEDRSRLTLV